MAERFHHPGSLHLPEFVLDETESHHLAHVLRGGVGDIVVLFDGNGCQVDAEIVAIQRRAVTLRPASTIRKLTATGPAVTLAVAPPKGDRFRWLVEKATELGVERLIPLQTQRTVVDPRAGKLDKLRQTVIAACKQSGNDRLMELTPSMPFEKLLTGFVNSDLVILHPGGTPLSRRERKPSREVVLIIGPEGGFTDDEIEQAVGAGATTASLGETILRTETAAIAAAALLRL